MAGTEALNGPDRVLQYFLRQGARDDSGWTALHWASQAGHPDLVERLVEECHCPVDAPNRAGCTPLIVACWHGHDLAVRALIARGADVNVTDCQGSTPLWVSCYKGQVPVVQTLLAAGAVHGDINRYRILTCDSGYHKVVGKLLNEVEEEAIQLMNRMCIYQSAAVQVNPSFHQIV